MTSLIGGKRVPKHHLRIEAYGTVDELMAHIGLLRDLNMSYDISEKLVDIQDTLMTCAAILATDCGDKPVKLPVIKPSSIDFLEQEIDKMESELSPLTSFILPGGHVWVSQIHIARTICRRAERCINRLTEECETDPVAVKYINRLSDYLFVLARFAGKLSGASEIKWDPGK